MINKLIDDERKLVGSVKLTMRLPKQTVISLFLPFMILAIPCNMLAGEPSLEETHAFIQKMFYQSGAAVYSGREIQDY